MKERAQCTPEKYCSEQNIYILFFIIKASFFFFFCPTFFPPPPPPFFSHPLSPPPLNPTNKKHNISFPQILNYQESIKSLKQEIFTLDQNYYTKLGIAFVTSSEFSFKKLKPADLPIGNVVLDVYLLRNQEVLITKNYQDEDELRNMLFSGFSNLLFRTFSQTLVPIKQDFNQVLVLEDKKFKFVPLSSPIDLCREHYN